MDTTKNGPIITIGRVVTVIALAMLTANCTRAPEPPKPARPMPVAPGSASPSVGDPVEGLRIALRVGCVGCHEKDGRGGGFLEETKDGDRFVAPNLTQRRALYDDAALTALLREGRTHDGHRPLGMPVAMFQHLSDQEIRGLIAWVRSLPKVAHPELPEGTLSAATRRKLQDGSFPFNDDRPDPGNLAPPLTPIEPLALGEYLATTSCVECHGRDLNGHAWGEKDDPPSLIVAKAYTEENFARLMKTGVIASGKQSATGFMSDVARERFSVLTDEEVRALKQYLDAR